MKEDQSECIFCKILSGDAGVSMIYEDEDVAVFPPIEPVNPGHCLVIPKVHAPYLQDVDEASIAKVVVCAKKVAKAVYDSGFRCEGVNLFLADGVAASQEVFHIHLHVIPRFEGDGFAIRHVEGSLQKMTRAQMDDVAAKIKKQLSKGGSI